MKYHLITYGCQMNTADSEEMAQPLKDRGFVHTEDMEQADVAIMNTCTVREHAEHKAISNLGRLREWKSEKPERILIVAGCAASLWGETLKKKYPYVDLVSPATRIETFPEAVAKVLRDRWNWIEESETMFRISSSEPEIRAPEPVTPFMFGSDATAYVTIMRGCNLNCSYCIVPTVRGREKYRALPDILEEIKIKTAQGLREVMLLGQTVNSYYWRGSEHTYDFADLLREVNALPNVELIRFMSPHPVHMRKRVIEAIRDCSKVARHVHLPVQSGSDRLLAQMKRLYTRKAYQDVVQELRSAVPGIQLTTDFIVGYPGETEEDFQETLSLIRAVRFNGLFAFKYSPRPGTPSAGEPDSVSEEEKQERLQRVLDLNLDINPKTATAPAALALS